MDGRCVRAAHPDTCARCAVGNEPFGCHMSEVKRRDGGLLG